MPAILALRNILFVIGIKTYNAYKGKGFDVIGISLDSKDADWKKAIVTLAEGSNGIEFFETML